MRIELTDPVTLPTRKVRVVELRPAGRKLVEAMAAVRLPTGFTDAQTLRFAARLSGLSDATLRNLRDRDLARLKAGLEEVFAVGRRGTSGTRAMGEEDAG